MKFNDYDFSNYQICSSDRLDRVIGSTFGIQPVTLLGEHDAKQLMKDLVTHLQLIFSHGMLPLYDYDSPELARLIASPTEYHLALKELIEAIYRESDFYAKPYGRFRGPITATSLSTDEFIRQLTLVIFSSDSHQVIKSKNGWESMSFNFARRILADYINIASVQTRKDYYTYLWLVSCIEQYVRLDLEGHSKFWYTHKLRETKEAGGITITRRMVNNLFANQNFEDDKLFCPGEMFNLPTPLPEPAQIFYQIVRAAKHEYSRYKF